MNHYLILCRSVTQAQRARLLLHNAGISCQIYRAPAGLSRRGCGYVVRIRESDYAQAARLLQASPIRPVKWFLEDSRGLSELH